MARVIIGITKMTNMRRIMRFMHGGGRRRGDNPSKKLAVKDEAGRRGGEVLSGGGEEHSCWIPHCRTGIYYPRGHERVMDEVPAGAASLGETTVWFRNVDGVDMSHPDYYNS